MANTGKVIGGVGSGAAAGTAILPGWGTAIGAVVGGLVGLFSGDDSAEQAQQNMAKALAVLDDIGVPPDLAKPIIYQQLQTGGKLTPVYEHALSNENFSPSQIQEAPGTRNDITATLAQLKGQAQGGLNPEQVANMRKLQQGVNANTISNIKGALQRQAQQGKSGAGDTLAASLNAAQTGATNLSDQASDIGAQGWKAQTQALQDLLSGQSNLRSQDINLAGTNANLKQQADLWKAQNSAARQSRNVANTNAADLQNWGRQNSVGDYNTQQQNAELVRQRQAQQQNFTNQLGLAQAKANAYTGQAQNQMQMGANNNQNFSNVMGGLTSAGTAIGQYNNNQDWLNAYKNKNQYGGVDYSKMPVPSSNSYSMPNFGSSYYNGRTIPNEQQYTDSGMPMYTNGGMIPNAGDEYRYMNGGLVNGHAKMPGNSVLNDTVPAMLSPGEIVVPREVSHDPKMATKFVMNQIDQNYNKAGPMFAKLHERLKKIEKIK